MNEINQIIDRVTLKHMLDTVVADMVTRICAYGYPPDAAYAAVRAVVSMSRRITDGELVYRKNLSEQAVEVTK